MSNDADPPTEHDPIAQTRRVLTQPAAPPGAPAKATSPCCSPAKQEVCCEPSAKDACCGAPEPAGTGCGCQ
jgi:hypothetical protein